MSVDKQRYATSCDVHLHPVDDDTGSRNSTSGRDDVTSHVAESLVRQWTTKLGDADDRDSQLTMTASNSLSVSSAAASSGAPMSRPPPSPRASLTTSPRPAESRCSLTKPDDCPPSAYFFTATSTEDVLVDAGVTGSGIGTAGSDSSSGRGSASPDTRLASRGKSSRFKKMLRPLRRTRSAGCSDDFHKFDDSAAHKTVTAAVQQSGSTDSGCGRHHRASETSGTASSDSDDELSSTVSSSSSSSIVKDSKPSFGRDVRQRFAFLRRHSDSSPDARRSTSSASSSHAKTNTSPSPTSPLSPVSPPSSSAATTAVVSSDRLQLWAESMENMLDDDYGRQLFGEFLRGEFSEENLEFWLACRQYHDCDDDDKLADMAQQIYDDFVAPNAPREINLESGTRQQTELNVRHPDRQSFQSAQKRIQALMERDSYRRFLESDIYRQHVLLASAKRTTPSPSTKTTSKLKLGIVWK